MTIVQNLLVDKGQRVRSVAPVRCNRVHGSRPHRVVEIGDRSIANQGQGGAVIVPSEWQQPSRPSRGGPGPGLPRGFDEAAVASAGGRASERRSPPPPWPPRIPPGRPRPDRGVAPGRRHRRARRPRRLPARCRGPSDRGRRLPAPGAGPGSGVRGSWCQPSAIAVSAALRTWPSGSARARSRSKRSVASSLCQPSASVRSASARAEPLGSTRPRRRSSDTVSGDACQALPIESSAAPRTDPSGSDVARSRTSIRTSRAPPQHSASLRRAAIRAVAAGSRTARSRSSGSVPAWSCQPSAISRLADARTEASGSATARSGATRGWRRLRASFARSPRAERHGRCRPDPRVPGLAGTPRRPGPSAGARRGPGPRRRGPIQLDQSPRARGAAPNSQDPAAEPGPAP